VTRSLIVAVVVWCSTSAVGCKPHDELVVDVMCGAICPCLADPGEAAACQAECSSELDGSSIGDECFACVLEAGDSCPAIFACDPVCSF
jgi:hypothetical protein